MSGKQFLQVDILRVSEILKIQAQSGNPNWGDIDKLAADLKAAARIGRVLERRTKLASAG